jgi:hypothetical protein
VVNSHPLYQLSYRGLCILFWLGDKDSNLDRQLQRLQSCR